MGRGTDERAAKKQDKANRTTVDEQIKRSKELERIQDIDERFHEHPREVRRGGGHTLIQELNYDDDDDEYFM